MSAGMLGVWVYFMAVRWKVCSRDTYMLAGTLGVQVYSWLSAGTFEAGMHIYWLESLEHRYISWLSTGTLEAGTHICQLACLECRYIS